MDLRRLSTIIAVMGSISITGLVRAQDSDLEALRRAMGHEPDVRVEHEEKTTPAADGKPPLKSEAWTFRTGVLSPMVRYSRYLNRPPDFTGGPESAPAGPESASASYPSLPNSDTGLGFDGYAWGNWYRGNAIRVLVNGRDVLAAQPATAVEWREGGSGFLRLVWEAGGGTSLSLSVLVRPDADGIYLRAELSPPGVRVDSLQVQLTGYPGGYGPAYGLPSHRFVATAHREGDVPADQTGKESPKLPFTAGESWVYYADRLADTGSLGLVVLPEEKPSGEVRLSSYGIQTVLSYPPGTRDVHLGLHAYTIVNSSARQLFSEAVPTDLEALRTLSFWPER
jgi:hypothetical protein